ncbi:MAG: hypothetical protein C0614_10685, partial [Desulfuromonas sp.]
DSTPSGQATREQIFGTAGDDSSSGVGAIQHNTSFSASVGQWTKVLHVDFEVFETLSSVELLIDPQVFDAVNGIPGFSVDATNFTWNGSTKTLSLIDTSTVADLLADGLDVIIHYDIAQSGELDFFVNVDASGTYTDSGGATIDYSMATQTLYFSWRDAVSTEDFNVIQSGQQVMILPREGLGADFYGLDGSDEIHAGAGDDTVYGDQYFDGSSWVAVVGGADEIHGGEGSDTLYGGDSMDTLFGDTGDDTIYGDDDPAIDPVMANGGADTIDGGTGNDLLYGGVGGDTIYGGGDNDTIIGGTGADIIYGGYAGSDAGIDTVSYSNDTSAGISAWLDGITAGVGGEAAGDILSGIENLIGGSGDDSFYGSASDNELSGGGGDDTFFGSGGSDIFYGGDSTADSGIDTVSYANSSITDGGVDASLIAGGSSGLSAGDSYHGIENLIGTDFVDTLEGDSSDNVLTGGSGGDMLSGGAGSDTASYANAGAGVTAVLDSNFWDLQTGDAEGDQFNSIENLTGSIHDDVLYGDSKNNILAGGDGADKLYGLDGNDTLVVNQGEDIVVNGGAGTDTVELHGLDTSSYDLTPMADTVDSVEILDIADGTDTPITLNADDILNMLDGGGGLLTIQADSGDSLTITFDYSAGGDHLDTPIVQGVSDTYSILDGAENVVAQVQWDVIT